MTVGSVSRHKIPSGDPEIKQAADDVVRDPTPTLSVSGRSVSGRPRST
jgi:hypothetical protein